LAYNIWTNTILNGKSAHRCLGQISPFFFAWSQGGAMAHRTHRSVHITLPEDLIEQLRVWALQPKRISRVIQILVRQEQARQEERQRLQRAMEQLLDGPTELTLR
jgi:hypothetical protein